MKKETITKTLGERVYWLRLSLNGEDEDTFSKVVKAFYLNSFEGNKVFLLCCKRNKYISENLNEKCNSNLFITMHFGFSNQKSFTDEMEYYDSQEIALDKFLKDEESGTIFDNLGDFNNFNLIKFSKKRKKNNNNEENRDYINESDNIIHGKIYKKC